MTSSWLLEVLKAIAVIAFNTLAVTWIVMVTTSHLNVSVLQTGSFIFFHFQYTLSGDAELFSPDVDPVDVASLEVLILTSDGPVSVSDIKIVVCCHPKGNDTTKIYDALIQMELNSCNRMLHLCSNVRSLIARFMGPTWGPSGADRTQMGPMWALWTLLSGVVTVATEKMPGVGVTKPIPSVSLFSLFSSIVKAHVSYWISRLYLAGVTAAQLWWHLPNMNVMQRI